MHPFISVLSTTALAFTTMSSNNTPQKLYSIRPKIQGVVFDMDGTLTVPNLDFIEMYRRCGVPPNQDILTAISSMPPSQSSSARDVIEEMEEEGRRTLRLRPGALELGKWLLSHGIPVGLVTRNSEKTVARMIEDLWIGDGVPPFHPAVTRDSGDVPHKPDPAALRLIADEWGVALNRGLLMVGDSVANDVAFGKNAGVSTALLRTGDDSLLESVEGSDDGGADVRVSRLSELARQIWSTFDIGGALGTDVPLLKYSVPVPTTPAAVAAAEGDLAALSSLSPTELNAVDEVTKNTPLIWAANAGRVDAVRALLRVPGVDVNARGYIGNTAVSRAARCGHVEVLRALKEVEGCVVDWDLGNEKLQYPLHYAAFKKKREAVDFLLECGANTFVLDRKGRTPAEDTSDEGIRAAILAKREETLRQLN